MDAGADINRPDSVDWTIAQDAATLGQFDKVFELLERGYNYKLIELGRVVQNRVVEPTSTQAGWQVRTREKLALEGVKFPIPPDAED